MDHDRVEGGDGTASTSNGQPAHAGLAAGASAAMKESDDDPAYDEIELVVGIVRGVGTPASSATEQLRNSLTNHGYDVRTIKVSQLLEDGLVVRGEWTEPMSPDRRISILIAEGNRLCAEAEAKDELAKRAIVAIKDERKAPATSAVLVGPKTADEAEKEQLRRQASRRAFIVDCLKRPEEVALLRAVYGDHFVLVGFQASDEARRAELIGKIAPSYSDPERDVDALARDLIDKDMFDGLEYGQNVLGTLYMSDAFVNVESDQQPHEQVRRLVAILFGDPQASPPSEGEYAMQLATQTSARSPELGLRVGAAIISANGDLLATGSNHHPAETQSPAFDAGALDIRRLARDTLEALAQSPEQLLSPGAIQRLENDGDSFIQELLRGPLKGSQLRDVTEYQRPVHAEMNALISAARQQVDLEGATLYVTAYPCHNCAKHLIALGVAVVYLEPYAKSRTVEMYGDVHTRFVPFTGVAPRRYASWFIYGRRNDRKDKLGVALTWSEVEKKTAPPLVTTQITSEAKEALEDWAVSQKKMKTPTNEAVSKPEPQPADEPGSIK